MNDVSMNVETQKPGWKEAMLKQKRAFNRLAPHANLGNAQQHAVLAEAAAMTRAPLSVSSLARRQAGCPPCPAEKILRISIWNNELVTLQKCH